MSVHYTILKQFFLKWNEPNFFRTRFFFSYQFRHNHIAKICRLEHRRKLYTLAIIQAEISLLSSYVIILDKPIQENGNAFRNSFKDFVFMILFTFIKTPPNNLTFCCLRKIFWLSFQKFMILVSPHTRLRFIFRCINKRTIIKAFGEENFLTIQRK